MSTMPYNTGARTMIWEPVPLVDGVDAICFRKGHFLASAKRDGVYYAWNIHCRREDGTLKTLNPIRFELADSPNVSQGLAWADDQLAGYEQSC